MNLVNAVLINNKQYELQTLNLLTSSMESEVFDIQSIENDFCHMILGEGSVLEHLPSLENKFKNSPLLNLEQLDLSLSDFRNLEFQDLEQITSKTLRNWNLAKNLSTIEDFSQITQHLKNLWQVDRDQFFEELWFFFKSSLVCEEIKIIFRDLKKDKEELKFTCLAGKHRPEFSSHDQYELLMKDYENEFQSPFTISEYNKENYQLVACAKIDQSPILILIQLREIGPLQQSLLVGLFKALQTH